MADHSSGRSYWDRIAPEYDGLYAADWSREED